MKIIYRKWNSIRGVTDEYRRHCTISFTDNNGKKHTPVGFLIRMEEEFEFIVKGMKKQSSVYEYKFTTFSDCIEHQFTPKNY